MTFRTNQPGSALASLSAFWEQSMQNRAMDLRKIPFWTARLFLFLRLSCLPSSFNDTLDADSSGGPGFCLYQAAATPTSIATAWRSSSLIRTTTNPNFSRSIYDMMLNRDRDREREGFCWLFETKALIGMVLIPMFLLVSFGFESLPLPVPYSSFESRHPGFFSVCRGKSLTFLH